MATTAATATIIGDRGGRPRPAVLTGGCGFIGSAVVRHMLRATDHVVVNVDKMTYAASEDALEEARHHNRHVLIRADIADAAAMRQVFATHDPDAVMHLAAESHVDRSIDGPAEFVRTNVVGTFALLDAARHTGPRLPPDRRARSASTTSRPMRCSARSATTTRRSPRTPPYDPRSPYSASKAASDHLVRAWQHTYGLPTLVSNTANNYGPWQFPEKLIPLVTLNALEGKPCRSTATAPTGATGCSWRTTRRRWCACWNAARRAAPTRSGRASRAPICRWCARSAQSSTACSPIRPARASG
jgi:dTDP-glucose 4,6-dehydratase